MFQLKTTIYMYYIFGIKCFQNPNRTIFPEFGTGQYISQGMVFVVRNQKYCMVKLIYGLSLSLPWYK